ncbi:hypothetical protein DYD21_07770 [Rhodohalobacter sp. SW132]|uniref:hypothetical protein n=1 Tax=Rhodohalobacter sp. SW132 TaxID=2293433 RepID=UPI000E37AADE|nr:hypothetical protein [Rhodohalobacter sp. SW132]REL37673.1 hypothetical protein DYD21_07770 [Rhodohalobacter sp. SW132]
MKNLIPFTSFRYAAVAVLLIAIISACGQDDDQRDFEQEAFSLPDGITQTDNSGQIVEGNEDPDDWRVAPFFQGLVYIDPLPFPNPVQVSDVLRIHVDPFQEALNGLIILVISENAANREPRQIYNHAQSPLPPGPTVVDLNPIQFSWNNTAQNARGLHRLILVDGSGNVISYGDILVE